MVRKPLLRNIEFRGTKLRIFPETRVQGHETLDSCSGDCAADLVMKLPTSASDEALGAFYSVWEKGNLGPVADESHVIKEDCTVLDPEIPDVIELMSPYDATYDSSMVPAKKAGDILFRDH